VVSEETNNEKSAEWAMVVMKTIVVVVPRRERDGDEGRMNELLVVETTWRFVNKATLRVVCHSGLIYFDVHCPFDVFCAFSGGSRKV
jgi:hypothetical protein